LRCPHLAVFGGADEPVPVADSARRFIAAASHRIQVGANAGLAPGFLGTLVRWIKAKAGIPGA